MRQRAVSPIPWAAESAVGLSASFEDAITAGRIVQDARDLSRRERDESFSVSWTSFGVRCRYWRSRSSGIGSADEVVW